MAKRIAKASGAVDYNILQNNGRAAHQMVDHVHFHMIPKPSAEQGLQIGWPAKETSKDSLQKVCLPYCDCNRVRLITHNLLCRSLRRSSRRCEQSSDSGWKSIMRGSNTVRGVSQCKIDSMYRK